ncbi:MAG: sulfatase-like hydrolase/transferase, partial [Kordiimonadaceae bacterium]|nr:sulfatase-like hydrolase/transferase [Kordiimonadaceae bacterium]
MLRKSLFLLFSLLYFETSFAAENWNIVTIVPDDHSRRAMGAYGDGQAVTPNFDKLAAEGARFNHAYAAAPVCSPSRAAFFSGQYPSQVGVNDFLMLTPYYAERGLDISAKLWPEILKENGYTTGLIGK